MLDSKVNNLMVQESYDSEKAVDEYAQDTKEIGIWKSEKVIVSKYFNIN